ncbi:MAG: oxo-acid lyase [Bacteroidales bacterium]|nr:oxo-acid lyase [Bacteroidales bacterium]
MSSQINFYKDKICLNVLAGSVQNAVDCFQAGKGNVLIGVLSTNFRNLEEAKVELDKYQKAIENSVSIGLGAGNPKQSEVVCEIAKYVKCKHYNQVFTGVGKNRIAVDNDAWINGLVRPSGTPGMVYIGTGEHSSEYEDQTPVSIETAILLLKDMGANAVKFFPMNGLDTVDEYKKICEVCAKYNFGLEPTGGIDKTNFKEIVEIALDHGVPKIIPHVYSSIIDKETGLTNVDDVEELWRIVEDIL